MRSPNEYNVTLKKELFDALESHPLRKHLSRSGLIRIAVSEFIERENLGKVEKRNETSGNKKGA